MHPYRPQNSMRVEIYGSKGVVYYARVGGGWQVYIRPKSRKPVVAAQSYARFPDPPHKENFVQCVRARNLQTNAKLDLMITHAPGHGFITDLKADQMCLP
jgi:hypothetical protein